MSLPHPPVRESFALVKGAVHLLEEGNKDDAEDETASSPTSPSKESDAASEARRRQLHAMVEQLRPEDTMKLVNALVFAEWTCQTCHDQRISISLACLPSKPALSAPVIRS